MMTLLTRRRAEQARRRVPYPLTDVAVFLIDRDAAAAAADVSVPVRETHGMTFDELQALVPVPLRRA
jgi:3-oxoadipate CoA-transferase beta subunit